MGTHLLYNTRVGRWAIAPARPCGNSLSLRHTWRLEEVHMGFQLSAKSLLANAFSQAHFGANIPAPVNPDFDRDTHQVIAELSVEHLRFRAAA